MKIYDTSEMNKRERAILVGVALANEDSWELDDSLDELAALADTAGADVVGRLTQRRDRPNPPYYIGKGKLEQLHAAVEELDATTVIMDTELSPAQLRNIEKVVECKVIDRSELILDIFATHARTPQAKAQVELAQYEYLVPRLKRMWTHLSRQEGGVGAQGAIGTRGPGETQLEVDRRLVQKRITHLRRKLVELEKQHAVQTKHRKNWVCGAFVGYTNAGKSTLMNSLSDADVYVQDQLFATLDATTRAIFPDNQQKVLLTDTVGFIRKLPHHLVASFHTTLQEIIDADFLLHVVDASHQQAEDQIVAVNKVLQELNALEKPTIMVYNKMDQLEDRHFLEWLEEAHGDIYVETSAKTGWGIETLNSAISDLVSQTQRNVWLKIPQSHQDVISDLYQRGRVLNRSYEDEHIILQIQLNSIDIDSILKLDSVLMISDLELESSVP